MCPDNWTEKVFMRWGGDHGNKAKKNNFSISEKEDSHDLPQKVVNYDII